MRNKIACIIAAVTFGLTSLSCPVKKVSAEPVNDMERSIQWALETAADDTHGYSQSDRWGPDYDCSSFVIEALREGGFRTGFAVTTKNMKQELTKYGFVWISWEDIADESGLLRGDVLLSSHHTEIYLGNGRKVGAHTAGKYLDENGEPITGDQDGNEISENDYKFADWQGVLRFMPKPFESLSPTDIGEQSYAVMSVGGKVFLSDCTLDESYDHDKMFFMLSRNGKAYTVRNMEGEYLTATGDEDICFMEVLEDNKTQSFYLCSAGNGYCIRPQSSDGKALTLRENGIRLLGEQEELAGQVFEIKLYEEYPSDHVWGEWEVLREADTENEGLREHTCTVCGLSRQESIPVLPKPDDSEPESSQPEESQSDSDSSRNDYSSPEVTIPEKNIPFYGDTDGSGKIDIIDAVMIISHINGQKALNDEQMERANVDGEKGISITDAVLVIATVNGQYVMEAHSQA